MSALRLTTDLNFEVLDDVTRLLAEYGVTEDFRRPYLETAISSGLFNRALVAGPPFPKLPLIPTVPAIVFIVGA